MALPNPSMSFSPFAILTAEEMNDLVENIEALSAGSGLADGAVTTPKLGDGAVTAIKTSGIWWEELGRVTLGSAGDTMSLTGIPARKYLYILTNILNSGSLNVIMRFNNDSSANYAYRSSANGAADTTSASQTSMFLNAGAYSMPSWIEISNSATDEKSLYMRAVAANTVGAGNVPGRLELSGKWSNISAQINRVDIINTGTGDMAIGSEFAVLGHN